MDLRDMSNTNMCSHPKFAIASLSLGNNVNHDLPTKIRVASSLGYDGIEMFIPDFEAFVDEVRKGQHSELFVSTTPSSSSSFSSSSLTSLSQPDLELECAHAISAYCTAHSLEIPIFQPYRNFENFRSQEELDTALEGVERWFRLMPALKCDLMLICSNHVPGAYPLTEAYTFEMYRDAQVEAFRQLGARAAKYNVRVGYEPLSWGTVVDNWTKVWDVVKRVDMDNVGVILDSFNTL
jgi:4-hydroxyphenylpyruvate dioxygenase